MQGQRMRSSGSRRRSSEGQSSVPLVDCYPSLSNLKCMRLARLLTLSPLTTPCTLTGLITCVSPAPADGGNAAHEQALLPAGGEAADRLADRPADRGAD